MNIRETYKYGNSTLQGGSGGITQEQVIQEIYNFQLPDFQVLNRPIDLQFGSTIVPSDNNFGKPLTYFDGEKDVIYLYDWGQPVTFNEILIDNYNVLKDSEPIFGEYYSVDLTNAYAKIGDQIIDNRLGDFRISFSLNLQQYAIGSRTLAFMGWIWEPEQFRCNYYAPLWAQTFVPAADGTAQFHIETQRFAFNLLELRRKAIIETEYPGEKEDLRMSIAFYLHQTSDKYLRITAAGLWIKKINELIDPDRFRGVVQNG